MECICSGVYLANRAMCSGKSVWKNSGFAQPVEISIARVQGADFAFLKDIQLTLQWCCYLWNQEETLQSWGEHRHESWGNICLCHWPAHQSTWSQHTAGALSGINSLKQATGKSALKKQLQVEVSQHLSIPPTAAVLDVSAVLWIVTWPVLGTVHTFKQTFKDNCKRVTYISVLTFTLTTCIQQKVASEQPELQLLELINCNLKRHC